MAVLSDRIFLMCGCFMGTIGAEEKSYWVEVNGRRQRSMDTVEHFIYTDTRSWESFKEGHKHHERLTESYGQYREALPMS